MSDNNNQSSNASDSDSDSASDLDDANALPSHWSGPPTSWQSLTEAERGLAASLDTLRNRDLSIHLFNAHALKRGARELETSVSSSKSVSQFPGIPEEDQAFKPSNGWTAWPLPPDDVPRTGEQIGPRKLFEEYTYNNAENDGAPSRELEDVLMGVTLKLAKERFESREEAQEEIYIDKGKRKVMQEDMNSIGSGSDYHDLSTDEPVIKEAPKSPQHEILIKPTVSADDEHSRILLLPSVRHTLYELDRILMALHHARKASHSEAGTTDDESLADTTSSEQGQDSPTKRSKGRPRKFKNLPNRSDSETNLDLNFDDELPPQRLEQADLLRTKGTHLGRHIGRPKKVYERLDGETRQEYLVRIAHIQKKPLPAFAPSAEITPPTSPSRRRGRERSRSTSAGRATSDESRGSIQRKLDLRDWSEVLGVAALVGFDADVLDRAARRCANLFGEGMVMRRMVETPFAEREANDEVINYEPDLVPAWGHEDMSSSDGESGAHSESESKLIIKPGVRTTSTPSRQDVFCPIPACPRRVQGFRNLHAMKRHLERGHKIRKEDVDDYILPSDEEMDGAVHVDGFLKPLKRAAAPRGRYKKERKKQRDVESGDIRGTDSDDAVIEKRVVGGREEEEVGTDKGSIDGSSS